MTSGLHYQLKQRVKNGYVKLGELRPNSRAIAQRLLAAGEMYLDQRGYLRLNEI